MAYGQAEPLKDLTAPNDPCAGRESGHPCISFPGAAYTGHLPLRSTIASIVQPQMWAVLTVLRVGRGAQNLNSPGKIC
jgi:hypothetical protein